MFAVQRRHRLEPASRGDLEAYILANEALTPQEFFYAPEPEWQDIESKRWRWDSPADSGFSVNNLTDVDIYLCEEGASAPTVFLLHALMSNSTQRYRHWAAEFNRRGWNACVVHLPFHHARTPEGYLNGELAITADLIRTAEGIRQAVCEVRQLMSLWRGYGCAEFGLIGTSYGGWVSALVASLEQDFRFVALLEPIVDIHHAIWRSPVSAAVRMELRRRKIDDELVRRHFPLISPLHVQPKAEAGRVLFVSGAHDAIAPPKYIRRAQENWPGAGLISVRQGHYGHRMMPAAWRFLDGRGLI